MNEKIFIFVFICGLLFPGCRTTILYNGDTAADVRSDLSELQTEQSETAGTAAAIEKTSGELAAGIDDAAGTAKSGEEYNRELESILNRIREQKLTEPGGESTIGPGAGTAEN